MFDLSQLLMMLQFPGGASAAGLPTGGADAGLSGGGGMPSLLGGAGTDTLGGLSNPAAVPGMVDPMNPTGADSGPAPSMMPTGAISPTGPQDAATQAANQKAALAKLAGGIIAPQVKPPTPGVPGGNKPPENTAKMGAAAQAPAIQSLLAALLPGGTGGGKVPTLGDLIRGMG